jgi:hypothetical protein
LPSSNPTIALATVVPDHCATGPSLCTGLNRELDDALWSA